MSYFRKVAEGDVVFGLVYGKGEVKTVWDNSHYLFEVEYKNSYVVPYTEDGIPGWSVSLDYQTVFYADDIHITDLDFTPSEKILSPKKIIKFRDKGKLEVKCLSGVWQPYEECPKSLTEKYLEDNKLSYFRKAK